MGNWTRNELLITGNRKKMLEFFKKYPEFIEINDIYPVKHLPPPENNIISDNRVKYWGNYGPANWDCEASIVDKDKKEIDEKETEDLKEITLRYLFITKGCNMKDAVFITLSLMDGINRVSYRYAEVGDFFCGKLIIENGKLLEKEHRYGYSWEVEYMLDDDGNEKTVDVTSYPEGVTIVEKDEFIYRGDYCDLWPGSG